MGHGVRNGPGTITSMLELANVSKIRAAFRENRFEIPPNRSDSMSTACVRLTLPEDSLDSGRSGTEHQL